MPNISNKTLSNLPIPLPPLEEQKRIVAVLDAAFEGLTRARTHIETNLQNARELFESELATAFNDIVVGFGTQPLIDLCRQRGITYGVIKLGDHLADGVPCLRTSNVKPLLIDTNGMKSISSKLSDEYSRTILLGGEVLVNVRGTLGGVCVVPPHMFGWNISREVAMVDINPDIANPDYVALFIATKDAQAWLTGVLKGAAYKGINLTDLRKLNIPLPDLKNQSQIVADLEEKRLRNIDLSLRYDRKLQDLDDLRQSLLQRAFAGELT